jgi:cytochrome bd ubiquinol oxidase subunit I
MEDLFAARSQMALSLGFHIIFAAIGMVMPFFMAVSHYFWLKKKDPEYLAITKAWSKGVAIFFVTGAVSGTVLSFELGLLWPTFMEHAGPIFGMPFSLEGAAFFVEAIALGFYLYGWGKMNQKFHWFTGLIVGLSGLISGLMIMAANGWMNAPAGFDFIDGEYINIDPLAAMFNEAWFSEALHMLLASFVSTSFAVAGIHAILYLKQRNHSFHLKAFKIAMTFGAIAAIIQPISGDISAKDVAKRQPAKLAAMEAHFHTEDSAALIIGGIVDEENEEVNYKIALPGMLSFLAHGDFESTVIGLDQIPKDERPPVAVVHYAFQIMVGIGTLLAGLGLFFLLSLKWKRWIKIPIVLKLFALATPLGFIALEAGWVVTEVGRQPWIIYGHMKTADALTPMPGIIWSLGLFFFIYITLALAVAFLMKRQIMSIPKYLESVSNAEKTKES